MTAPSPPPVDGELRVAPVAPGSDEAGADAAGSNGAVEGTGVEVSVVIPCLNEAESIGTCVAKARRCLEELELRAEVVVADNGSTDGSAEIARRSGARVVHVAERGYGSALLGGIAAARGQLIVMGDADDTYDFSRLEPFIAKLQEGYDLVMGNRFLGGIEPGAMPFLHRYLGNPVLSWLGRLFFKSPVRDFHCGLRAFRKDAIVGLDLRTTGMEFASEMVVKATLQGLRIAEVPTTLSPAARTRAPHLRPWRDGWRHLRFLLIYSPRWLFLYPGLLLMVVGTAMVAWLFPQPRAVWGVGLDIHTMLFAAMAVVIGFQSVLFAVLSKIFAVNEGLLPENRLLARLFRYVTLEVGLLVGLGLLAAGAAGSAYAFFLWSRSSFGAIVTTRILRIVIPALTSMVLGAQVFLASFFLSILGLKRR